MDLIALVVSVIWTKMNWILSGIYYESREPKIETLLTVMNTKETPPGEETACLCYTGEGGEYLTNCEDWFSLEEFASFSQWWLGPVMDTMSKIQNDWAAIDPLKVHGFISRTRAKRKLMTTRLPGVYILRFSDTNPGSLILGLIRKVSKRITRTENQVASLPPNSESRIDYGSKPSISRSVL